MNEVVNNTIYRISYTAGVREIVYFLGQELKRGDKSYKVVSIIRDEYHFFTYGSCLYIVYIKDGNETIPFISLENMPVAVTFKLD